jgi:hypothetical protein
VSAGCASPAILVYSEGEVADALFLIEMGTADITPMGKETVFVTMGSGQGFGELSFFERGPRPASAYAREPTHLLRIPFARLSQVLAERPELALLVGSCCRCGRLLNGRPGAPARARGVSGTPARPWCVVAARARPSTRPDGHGATTVARASPGRCPP